MALVQAAIEEIGREEPLDVIVAGVVQRLTDRSIPLRYYRRETIGSWEARTSWVPPELDPLPTLGAR
jgi:hypothetical protein